MLSLLIFWPEPAVFHTCWLCFITSPFRSVLPGVMHLWHSCEALGETVFSVKSGNFRDIFVAPDSSLCCISISATNYNECMAVLPVSIRIQENIHLSKQSEYVTSMPESAVQLLISRKNLQSFHLSFHPSARPALPSLLSQLLLGIRCIVCDNKQL